jgi:hypothetical protein
LKKTRNWTEKEMECCCWSGRGKEVRENKKLNLINVYSKIMQDGGNKVGAHIIRNTFAMKAFATTSIILTYNM